MDITISCISLQQDWQAGLKAVEDAMWVMPRSHHKFVLCLLYTIPSMVCNTGNWLSTRSCSRANWVGMLKQIW